MTQDKTTFCIEYWLQVQGSNLKFLERWVNLAVALCPTCNFFFLLINFHIDCATRVSARSVSLPSHLATGQVFDLSIPNFQSWPEKNIEYHNISIRAKWREVEFMIWNYRRVSSIRNGSTTYYPYIEAGKLQKLEVNYCECCVVRILKDIYDNENFWSDLVLSLLQNPPDKLRPTRSESKE